MSNNEDQKKKLSGPPHVSDLILGSLKPRTGKETSKWIAGLADNAVKDAAEAASREIDSTQAAAGSPQALKQSAAKQAVVMFTDQIFDHFQQYEYDFNRTVAGTDYVVTIERPIFSNEQIRQRFGASEAVKVFKGRVSTRHWTLIVRAFNGLIEAWVLPVEQILSFRADDDRYPPYIVIEPMASRTGDLVWKVNGSHVAAEQVRVLAKAIFTSLIRRARGETAENELFAVGAAADQRSTGQIITSTSVTGYPSVQPSGQSFPLPSSTGERRILPVGSVPLQGQSFMGERRPHVTGSEPLQGQTSLSDSKSYTSGNEPLQSTGKSPKQTLHNTRKQSAQSSQPMPPSIAPTGSPSVPTVDSAIISLNAVIMRELSILSARGADAFAKQDMVMVEQIVRKTNKVRELHNQINQLLEQWKKAFEEATEP